MDKRVTRTIGLTHLTMSYIQGCLVKCSYNVFLQETALFPYFQTQQFILLYISIAKTSGERNQYFLQLHVSMQEPPWHAALIQRRLLPCSVLKRPSDPLVPFASVREGLGKHKGEAGQILLSWNALLVWAFTELTELASEKLTWGLYIISNGIKKKKKKKGGSQVISCREEFAPRTSVSCKARLYHATGPPLLFTPKRGRWWTLHPIGDKDDPKKSGWCWGICFPITCLGLGSRCWWSQLTLPLQLGAKLGCGGLGWRFWCPGRGLGWGKDGGLFSVLLPFLFACW